MSTRQHLKQKIATTQMQLETARDYRDEVKLISGERGPCPTVKALEQQLALYKEIYIDLFRDPN